jgi:hypothetical protein
MLVEGLPAVECSITFVAFIYWIVTRELESRGADLGLTQCQMSDRTHHSYTSA